MTPRVSSHQAMKFLGVSPATRRRCRGWSRAAAILSCTLRRRSAVRIATESSSGREGRCWRRAPPSKRGGNDGKSRRWHGTLASVGARAGKCQIRR